MLHLIYDLPHVVSTLSNVNNPRGKTEEDHGMYVGMFIFRELKMLIIEDKSKI